MPRTRPTDMRTLLRSIPVFAAPLPGFDPDAAPEDPVALFTEWITAAIAAGVPEPHAMVLATAGADGAPSARTLILKDVDDHGWRFASTAGSRKGRELAQRPSAALCAYWPLMGRQVRVRGPVRAADPADSAADFLARSPEARAEALVGRQSRPLDSREDLDRAAQEARAAVDRQPDLIAEEWTLYTVAAEEVEFWQADRERRHTRLQYRCTGTGWSRRLLWP